MRMPSIAGSSGCLPQCRSAISLRSLSCVSPQEIWAAEQAAAERSHTATKEGTPNSPTKPVPNPHKADMLTPRCSRLPWANELLIITHQRPSRVFSAELMKFRWIRSDKAESPRCACFAAVHWQTNVPQQRPITPPTTIVGLLRAHVDSGV